MKKFLNLYYGTKAYMTVLEIINISKIVPHIFYARQPVSGIDNNLALLYAVSIGSIVFNT